MTRCQPIVVSIYYKSIIFITQLISPCSLYVRLLSQAYLHECTTGRQLKGIYVLDMEGCGVSLNNLWKESIVSRILAGYLLCYDFCHYLLGILAAFSLSTSKSARHDPIWIVSGA